MFCTFSDFDTNILLDDISSGLKDRNPDEYNRLERMIGICRNLYSIYKSCDSLSGNLKAEPAGAGELTENLLLTALSHSRVSAGRAFLTAEFSLYSRLCSLTARFDELVRFRNELYRRLEQVMLMLMAEEVCTGIVRNSGYGAQVRNAAAEKLFRFWEFRDASDNASFAMNMLSIRESRKTILPTFGTLFGTFELMKLSSLLTVRWHDFFKTCGRDRETLQALEEYIFGFSSNELSMIRNYMAERSITAVSDVELHKILPCADDISMIHDDSPAHIYRSYIRRTEYVLRRLSTGESGPQKTIEEIFMIYLLETEGSAAGAGSEGDGGGND